MALKSLAEAGPDGLRALWDRLSPLPGGKKLFSTILGRMAPYTGTMGAEVVELRRGFGRVELRDRKAVRNHLGSVHAIALMNLAEMASGVAMMYALPSRTRGIITGLSIEYLKKARGTLTATAEFEPVPTNEKQDVTLTVDVHNAAGDLVARAKAIWRIGPAD